MRHRLRRSHHHSGHRPKHHKETSVKFSQHHLWYLGLGIGLTVLTWLLKPVIALLAASAAIAYILDPLIDRFEENGWSRDQGIAIIVGIGSLFILVGIIAFIPPVIAQIDKLSDDMRIVLGNLDQTLQNLTIWIEQKTGQEIDLGLAEIQETLPIWIEQFSQEWQAKLLDIVKGLFLRGMGLINTLLNLLLLPVFTYYLLRDWDILLADAFELIPHKFRPMAVRTFGEVNTRLNAFIIGQIKVCLALAVLYTVGLLIIGIDLAVPIGVISGILFVIPYVGTVFGIFAASILALINFGVDWHVLGVFAVFGIAQTIEGYYLTPKIVGESVGLSPMVVMIALIVGASFMGIWGMLIAIPVTAVLSVLATEWLTNYRESDTFLQHKD
jgi:predicted PurR-regulated permease PerM